jgi:hypothetical protein
VDQGLGLTLLPDLAVRTLVSKDEKRRVKLITHPRPVREVSLVQVRTFQKKRIVDALYDTVQASVPPELLDKQSQKIIEFIK